MNASTFDTLTAARALEAAGVERRQAEAHAEQLRSAAGADLERLATKADLEAFEGRMTAALYRALWIQGAGIVAVIGGFIAIAAALKLL